MTTKTSKINKKDVIEFISNMTVLELSELVKEFEERFGVSAATSVPVSAAAAPEKDEQLELAPDGNEVREMKLLRNPGGWRYINLLTGFEHGRNHDEEGKEQEEQQNNGDDDGR